MLKAQVESKNIADIGAFEIKVNWTVVKGDGSFFTLKKYKHIQDDSHVSQLYLFIHTVRL